MNGRMIAMVGSLALVAGCGGNDEDKVKLVAVSGTVTLDGKPLEGAILSFLPDATNEKPQTDGGDVTGAGGAFVAKYRNRDGLAPGKYRVTVSRPGEGPGGAAAGKALPEEIAKSPYMAGLAKPAGTGKKEPPPWLYGDAGTTPLKQEVTASGGPGLKFDLKSAGK